MRTGGVFLIDEISLADDSVLERLNSVLEPERSLLLAEKGGDGGAETIQAAPGFRVVATMNPGGDYGKKEVIYYFIQLVQNSCPFVWLLKRYFCLFATGKLLSKNIICIPCHLLFHKTSPVYSSTLLAAFSCTA